MRCIIVAFIFILNHTIPVIPNAVKNLKTQSEWLSDSSLRSE